MVRYHERRHRGKYIFESATPETIPVSSDSVIKRVTTVNCFKDFHRVPWLVYKNDKYWVPPLWEEMKDFFKRRNLFWGHADTQLFVAYKNKTPVGRVAAIIDYKYVESVKDNVGFFGFFECINDSNIATALLEAAETWLSSKQISTMLGPVNGRVDMGCGLLYQGFNETPYIYDTYSPKYYIDFVENHGMKKNRDLVSYFFNPEQPIPEKVKETAERCIDNGVKIRCFNRLRANKELKWWIKLMMETFSSHWGYVEVSEKEVRTRFGVKQIRWIVDPCLFLVAEKDDQPVAFKWSLPDYNQIFKTLNGRLGVTGALKFLIKKHTINRVKFNFVGVKKEYRGQGIGTCMNYYTLIELKKRGCKSVEIGWIDENNIPERKATEKIGAKLYKIYRVYEKKLV